MDYPAQLPISAVPMSVMPAENVVVIIQPAMLTEHPVLMLMSAVQIPVMPDLNVEEIILIPVSLYGQNQ